MEVRDGLYYSEEHEWVRIEDNIAVIGITDYAQKELRGVVFVELPEVGDKVVFQKDLGYVESTKAVNAVLSPVSGEVIEVNSKLEDSPELVNEDPYGEGWMIKVKMSNKSELSELLNGREYSELMDHLVK
ncbi:MAG: glycine cleavage system protein GcvH [Euryarchaeota archaeon]|nr:glycine cleavage system protein GcvH [Euryarchaeota archaeon]MBU4340807.1 glycine cleavage system protein GcvH [Euryarchaeota archaeon]